MRSLLVGITAAALALIAPAAPRAAPWDIEKAAAPFKGTQLNVIFLDRPGYRAGIKLLPEFEKKTGIKVNYEVVPYENTREKQVLNFTARGDLTIALVDLVWIGEFAESGWIVPIDKFTKDASITDPNLNLKGFFPLLLDAFGSWGGAVYGLPFENYSGLLFYNKCMLKEPGFTRPPGTSGCRLVVPARLAPGLDITCFPAICFAYYVPYNPACPIYYSKQTDRQTTFQSNRTPAYALGTLHYFSAV